MKLKLLLIFFLCFYLKNSFAQNTEMDKGLIAFDAKDFKLAVAKLRPYAEQGNCLAQFAVGFSYLFGEGIKNDSLARYWLLLSAKQKQPNAMGPLAVSYFSSQDYDAKIQAYLWAVLAAEYDPKQKMTTTRLVIKEYLKPDELTKANILIENYKKQWQNKENCN